MVRGIYGSVGQSRAHGVDYHQLLLSVSPVAIVLGVVV